MTSSERAVSGMAAVRAELRLRDGSSQKLEVQVEENLRSLLSGIVQLNQKLRQLLSELVDGDRPGTARGAGQHHDAKLSATVMLCCLPWFTGVYLPQVRKRTRTRRRRRVMKIPNHNLQSKDQRVDAPLDCDVTVLPGWGCQSRGCRCLWRSVTGPGSVLYQTDRSRV